jgi:hypothetical protein
LVSEWKRMEWTKDLYFIATFLIKISLKYKPNFY